MTADNAIETRKEAAMAKEGGARRRLRELREAHPDVEEEYQRQAPRYQLLRQLIEARREAGISQTELARRIGKTQSVIARLESGEHSPKLETVNDAARAMGYRLEVRLMRDPSIEPDGAATAAS